MKDEVWNETFSTALNSLSLSRALPVLVCLYGSPGAGKTTIGHALQAEFPTRCCFISVGEAMRHGNKQSAIDIIRTAITDGRRRCCEYVVADSQFTARNLLDLIDLEQSEVSATIALVIDTKRSDCEHNLSFRKRKDDEGNAGRIERWARSSFDTMRVLNAMGAKSLTPQMVRTNQHEMELACRQSARSALAAFEVMLTGRANALELPVGYQKAADLEASLMSVLCVHSLSFAMPVAIENSSDMQFLEMNDYKVSHKADGTRAWVFTHNGIVYSRRRDGSFRRHQLALFPPGIVIDAEVMACKSDDGANASIIAFDILAVDGRRIWHRNLDARLDILRSVPGLRFKEHFPLVEIQRCLEERELYSDFKSDGLVFTPNTSYCFDGAIPLFKWQRPKEVMFDLSFETLRTAVPSTEGEKNSYLYWRNPLWREVIHGEQCRIEVQGLSPDIIDPLSNGIAVCSYSSRTVLQPSKYGTPSEYSASKDAILITLHFEYVRFDKLTPNAASTVTSQLHLCVAPVDLRSLSPSCIWGSSCSRQSKSKEVHPARALELAGTLKEFLTSSSDIEIIQNGPPGLGVANSRSLIADPLGIARGLVVDGTSNHVVAMSFPRFPHAESGHDKVQMASVKFDGSMILAYMWKGKLITNTKRRHDSEQSTMANEWLRRYSDIEKMEESWTYVFEAVLSDNYLVLTYKFDALILLTVFDPQCCEISDPGHRSHIAELLQVPLAPRVYGTITLLKTPKLFGSKEGWVLEEISDSGHVMRSKVVCEDYKEKHTMIRLFHPELVWRAFGDYIKIKSLFAHSTEDFRYLRANIPGRYREQWDLMESAISIAYFDALKCSTGFHTDLGLCTVCGCSAVFDDDGDRICFCGAAPGVGCSNRRNVLDQILKINPNVGKLPIGSVLVGGIEVAGVSKEMIAYNQARPKHGVVSGYSPPKFLMNNFAKGWTCAPYDDSWWRISIYNTFKVVALLDLSSTCTMRLISRSVDNFIRRYYFVFLEQAHSLCMARIESEERAVVECEKRAAAIADYEERRHYDHFDGRDGHGGYGGYGYHNDEGRHYDSYGGYGGYGGRRSGSF